MPGVSANHMKKKSIDLNTHSFLIKVMQDDIAIDKAVLKPSCSPIKPELKRDMDEYEFYVAMVGNRISHLISTVRQLEEIPKYINALTKNWKQKRVTWSTYSLLLYHIENFIIRTATIYDKTIKLVDAVFHLQNDDKECKRNTVLKNAHVSRSNIPTKMADLEKRMDKYSRKRNSIIHHQNYDEDFLKILEMYTIMLEREMSEDRKKQLTEIARGVLVDTAFEHGYNFSYSCQDIKESLNEILIALESHYDKFKGRLLSLCGYNGIYNAK
jgi:hypothetical protein